jgi:protein-S-isoprenylcysteine O-methyltransferase Ste14
MESPSLLLFSFLFIFGRNPKNLVLLVFFFLWEFHYAYRAFVYPLTLRDKNKKIPIVIVLMGLVFNLGNAFINGYYLFALPISYPNTWLLSSRFIFGLILILSGLIINRRSDQVLRKLRKPGETGYGIPNDGLFNWISCPNYLGEIMEWVGWAIATWSLPGFVFAFWTFANLVPRALSHHRWYQKTFPDYPQDRKALIPRIF